jgi:hypothetical protein
VYGIGEKNSRVKYEEDRRERDDDNYPRKKKYIYKEGDWQCPNEKCRNQNFAKRVVCNLCKTQKPKNKLNNRSRSRSRSRHSRNSRSSRSRSRNRESRRHKQRRYRNADRSTSRSRSRSRPKYSRSKSRSRSRSNKNSHAGRHANSNNQVGIFKDGDWKCNSCNNINFAWRTKCNICKRSKSLSRNNQEKRSDSKYNRNESHKDHDRNKSRRYDERSSRTFNKRRSRSLSESSLFSSKSIGSRKNRKGRESRDISPKQTYENPNDFPKNDKSPSASPKFERKETNKHLSENNSFFNNWKESRSRSGSSNNSDSIHKMRFSDIDS